MALPADASSGRKYLDSTHRGRGHRADGAGAHVGSPAEGLSLEALVIAELTEAGVLATSAGRVLVLCARRVESTAGAADAVRQYWAARADVLPGAPPAPAGDVGDADDASDVEGGDDLDDSDAARRARLLGDSPLALVS